MKRLNILGNVFSIILAAIVTVAACFFTDKVQIYNPAIIMAIVMVFFTAVIGRIAGAVSLVYSILYFLYFYSENYRLGYYTPPLV